MTTKFENMTKELDKLCVKTNTVKTRKQARELSLKKWTAIKKMAELFFGEFNVRCGFCGYGEFMAALRDEAPRRGGRCRCCGVKTVCDEMLEKAHNLAVETLTLIDGLIAHLKSMKVAD